MESEDAVLLSRAGQYLAAGDLAAASSLARQLAARNSTQPGVYQLLGITDARNGNFQAAAEHFATAIALEPRQPELHRSLGHACKALGRLDEAEASFRTAISLAPDVVLPLCDLGNLLWTQGRLADAARVWERALELAPESPEVLFAFGSILGSLGYHARAVTVLEQLDRQSPAHPGLQVNLGLALMKLGRCTEAIDRYDRAIAANPGDYMAHNNRGNALREQQRMDEAVLSYRRALAIKPDHATAHSNLLLTLNYIEDSQERIHEETLHFARRQATRLAPGAVRFANDPDPGRVLRVGYVSADFRGHSVAYFVSGPLECHDRARVRVHCYSNVHAPDSITARLRSSADEWRSIVGLTDAAVADRIRDDGIDILVDLGGHTGGNRLLAFARRPAPVQVTWLGYPNSTGVPGIGYRLTDAVADPSGDADALHTEELIRLPRGFLCYQPAEAVRAAGFSPPPRQGPSRLTFGSFNALSKITPVVVRVWAGILAQLPEAQLLLKSESFHDAETRGRFTAMFVAHGITPGRLELVDRISDHREHLALYSRIDIALDPFPYNGTTTTCEALWMGVPVLTLRGNRHAARVGASILEQAGLGHWVAADERDYAEMAIQRGLDRQALDAERSRVAGRIRASPLLDATGFTRSLEGVYRDLWVRWCASRQ